MILREENPDFLNSFLDYNITILNKSPNTIKEYNYDISNFLKFIKLKVNSSKVLDLSEVNISNTTLDDIKKIKLEDIHRIHFIHGNYS